MLGPYFIYPVRAFSNHTRAAGTLIIVCEFLGMDACMSGNVRVLLSLGI